MRRAVRILPLAALLLFAASAAPALAADRYDCNCNEVEQTAEQKEAEEMAKTSPIADLAFSLGQKTLQGRGYSCAICSPTQTIPTRSPV